MKARTEFSGDYASQILALRGIDQDEWSGYVAGKEKSSSIIPKRLHGKFSEFILRNNLVVYGDYDADGITSIASVLSARPDAEYICPEREDGYGLSEKYLSGLSGKSILTVDCGIRSKEIIDKYSSKNDFFVTDHHVPVGEIPNNSINPKVYSNGFTGYSGSGVVKKLMDEYSDGDMICGDLAAIGTIADVMPIIEENRVIVRNGLATLRHFRPPWLMEVCSVYNINIEYLNEEDIAFYIAPLINAAGRMGDVNLAIVMLSASDTETQVKSARKLIRLNEERKSKIKDLIRDYYESSPEDKVEGYNFSLFFSNEKNSGLIGLLASRIAHTDDKVAIVFCDNGNGTYTASMRSPGWYNCMDYLEEIKEYTVSGGGHENAAGFTINAADQLDVVDLSMALDRELGYESRPEVEADFNAEWYDAMSLLEEIDALGPYGNAFERPTFLSEVYIDEREISSSMKKKGHFSADIYGYRAIGFNMFHNFFGDGRYVVKYTVKRDTFRGANSPMALIEKIEKVK